MLTRLAVPQSHALPDSGHPLRRMQVRCTVSQSPSFWDRLRQLSWFQSKSNGRYNRRRKRTIRLTAFESLEERDLFAVSITSSTNTILPDVPAIVINGSGFDPIVANDTVTFDNGTIGTVVSATTTQLIVEITDPPDAAGELKASVTTTDSNSGALVQVATVVPVVTESSAVIGANASTLTILGSGFDTTAANNTLLFSNGAVGTVQTATRNSLTVNLTTKPTAAGDLTVVVTTNGQSSGSPILVATVKPVVTSSTSNLAANASSIIIQGFGFSTTPASNTVVFNNGAVGTVSAASATQLTVDFTTAPTGPGSLTAVVTTNTVSNGSAVQVATVQPVITPATSSLAANATTLTINGFGFSPTASNNTVSFTNGAVGTVTSATSTSLVVTLTTLPTAAGDLEATVTSGGVTSSSAQVAEVIPVVTAKTTSLAADSSTVTISGFGFSTTAANNVLVFDNGAVGTVSTATATLLTVTLSTKPTTAGSLSVTVTTNSNSNGSPVQIASVRPVITSSTTALDADASTIQISGAGFNATTLSNNVITFNNGAVGNVTSATPTLLTVTFTTKPTTAGSLTASVTTNGFSSGAAVQVPRFGQSSLRIATVLPQAQTRSPLMASASAPQWQTTLYRLITEPLVPSLQRPTIH